ncbi:MAG TPA: tetratricopeptide repeat protein [Planctomycetaceae bacterium]|nr:tetratricopeptide repeat protein [Planctomycetaceae bacterium]
MSSPRYALALGLVTTLAGCNLMSSRTSNEFGRIQYQRGNYTAARWDFQRAVLEDPDNADSWHNLATTIKKQGDLAGAELAYRRALTANPSHQPSYHGLAELLAVQGRHGEALALLGGWANTETYTAKPLIEMAWFQQSIGDVATAERTLHHALKVQPGHPTALAHLGQIYHHTGRTTEAVAMYRRSLYANWNQPAVQSRLAALDTTFNRPTPAVRATAVAWRPAPAIIGSPAMALVPAGSQPTFVEQAAAGPTAAFQTVVVAPGRAAGAPLRR